jgi:hypothetical protein
MRPEKAKVMALDITKPKTLTAISLTTADPLALWCDVSTCQTGAVAVLPPFPMPATSLPMTISFMEWAAVWMMIPVDMMIVKIINIFFLPSFSPTAANNELRQVFTFVFQRELT